MNIEIAFMGIIHISGIKIYAYHGCLEEESVIGAHYEVDVVIRTNFEKAAAKDDLSRTVDYVMVNEVVSEQMAVRSRLIEHAAKRIADALRKRIRRIEEVQVTVTKLKPPMSGDVHSVAVIYTSAGKSRK